MRHGVWLGRTAVPITLRPAAAGMPSTPHPPALPTEPANKHPGPVGAFPLLPQSTLGQYQLPRPCWAACRHGLSVSSAHCTLQQLPSSSCPPPAAAAGRRGCHRWRAHGAAAIPRRRGSNRGSHQGSGTSPQDHVATRRNTPRSSHPTPPEPSHTHTLAPGPNPPAASAMTRGTSGTCSILWPRASTSAGRAEAASADTTA